MVGATPPPPNPESPIKKSIASGTNKLRATSSVEDKNRPQRANLASVGFLSVANDLLVKKIGAKSRGGTYERIRRTS